MGRGGGGSSSHGLGVSGGMSLGQFGVRPPSPQGTSARCVVLQGRGVSGFRCGAGAGDLGDRSPGSGGMGRLES